MPRLTKLNQLGTLQRGKRGNFCVETLQWNALQLNCSQTECACVCMWVRVCTSVCACVWAQWSIAKVIQSSRKSQRNSEIPFDSSSGRNKWLPPSLSHPLLVSFFLLTHFSVCHSHLNPPPSSARPLPNPMRRFDSISSFIQLHFQCQRAQWARMRMNARVNVNR